MTGETTDRFVIRTLLDHIRRLEARPNTNEAATQVSVVNTPTSELSYLDPLSSPNYTSFFDIVGTPTRDAMVQTDPIGSDQLVQATPTTVDQLIQVTPTVSDQLVQATSMTADQLIQAIPTVTDQFVQTSQPLLNQAVQTSIVDSGFTSKCIELLEETIKISNGIVLTSDATLETMNQTSQILTMVQLA